MKISSKSNSDVLIVELDGEIDHSVTKDMREKVDMLIDKTNTKSLIIDLKYVSFMDSAGIGFIMGRYKKLKAVGGTLCVTNVSASIDKILVISGLYNLVRKI